MGRAELSSPDPPERPLLLGLHASVLAAFALAQPLFDLLAPNTELLIAHRLDRLDVLWVALALCPLLPLLVGASAWLVALAPRPFGGVLGASLLALLGAAVALAPLARTGLPAPAAAGAATLLGVALAAAWQRFPLLRRALSALTVVLVLFPVLFLGSAPVRALIFPSAVPEVAAVPAPGGVRDVPVVFVVFDALPLDLLLDESGGIDATRYPGFAALAGRATWYRNATSVAEDTSYALPAILTGRYPRSQLGPPTAAAYPLNLFTLLEPSHALSVLEPYSALCPGALCHGAEATPPRRERLAGVGRDLVYVALHALLPAEWTASLPPVDATPSGFGRAGRLEPEIAGAPHVTSTDANALFARFLAGLPADDPRPGLHFVHLGVPHDPYLYLPSGRRYGPLGANPFPRGVVARRWRDDEWAVTQALQRHLLQVAFADALLKRLIERLEATGLLDRSLVIVTSDHGASFRTGEPVRAIGATNVGDILSVPLLVKLPGQQRGEIDDRNVESVDILPTVLEAVGVALTQEFDGRSLLASDATPRPAKLVWLDTQRRVPGQRRVRELPARLDDREERVHRILRRFDFSRGPDGVYAIGPHRELHGRRVEELEVVADAGHAVSLLEPEAFEDVDATTGFVPALVMGDLAGADLASLGALPLAIAVNGTLRATTVSHGHSGERAHFAAMIPEAAFRPGANEVEIYRIEEGPAGPRLAALPRDRPLRFAMATDAAGMPALVVASSGRLHPLRPRALSGRVWSAEGTLRGSAFAGRRLADWLLTFRDGRLFNAHRLRDADADADGAVHMEIRRERLGDAPDASLRFFGLAGVDAAELPFLAPEAPPRVWQGPALELRLAHREGVEGIAAGEFAFAPLGAPLERAPRRAPILVFRAGRFEGIASATPAGAGAAERRFVVGDDGAREIAPPTGRRGRS